MWPSAVMLSHHIARNPSIVIGDDDTPDGDVMELGAGCGLVGFTAATLLQHAQDDNEDKVIFTDYNPAVLENLQKNVDLNDFDVDHEVLGLDWFDQEEHLQMHQHATTWKDVDGNEHDQVRLILGADLLVCSNDADLVASTIDCALVDGGQAFILGADASRRFGVMNFPDACESLGLEVTVYEDMLDSFIADDAKNCDSNQMQLMGQLQLGGYNQRGATMAHDFTMFQITKPISSSA